MRKIIGILLVAVVFTGSAFRTLIKDDTFQVDTGKSNVLWTGKNVAGGKHTGELKISAGTLVFNGNQLTGGRFTVDMSSLTVTDLQGDRAVRLAGHLKNEDFFDAPKFPESAFTITKVDKAAGKDQVNITGNLQIRGITHAVTFPATLHRMSSDEVHATAKGIKIDRTKFDIKYRSGNFFSGLGDRAISDEFELDVELFAVKK